MAPRSVICAMVIAALLALTAYSQAQTGDEPAIEEFNPAPTNPWRDVPPGFELQGVVTDSNGNPAAGITIATGTTVLARSDDKGHFALPEPVAPATLLTFSHPEYAELRRAAGFFYAGPGQATQVELFALSERFDLTRAGGEFASGGISLKVPEGAVSEAVTVRSTRLPLDMAYEQSAEVQIQRLGAVEFAPAGLTFNKPVTVAIDLDYVGPSSSANLLLLDRGSGRYTGEKESLVTIADGKAVFSVDHFSRRAVGDPAQGIVKKHIVRSNDINGDGKLTSEDADFVILLSGGTHSAEYTITTSDSVTVSKSREAGTSSGSSSSASVGGGIEIGGAGIEVSHTVSREQSSEVVKKAGLERSSASSTSSTDRLSVGEYGLRCKYYTGIYDYYLVEIWQRHTPVEWEQKALEDAWAGRSNPDAEWSHFTWNRSTSIALNKSMYGFTRLALRMGPKGLEIYRMTDSFVVKQRFATYPVNCKPGNLEKRVEEATRGATDAGTAAGNMKDNFRFFGGGDAASGYKGWGILDESDKLFKLGQECGNESEGEYIITTSLAASAGEDRSSSSSQASETEAKVSGGAGIGPVKISAEVSASSGTSSGRSEAESYARNVMSSATTHVKWHIINAHEEHYSDHMVAPLHNVKTVNGHDIKRPIGIMLLRYRQYPCGETPPTTTTPPPDDSGGPDDSGPGGKGPAARTPDTRPPVITPSGDSSADSGASKPAPTSRLGDSAYITPQPLEMINVVFTSAQGTTVINRQLVGQPRGIEVIGIAPEELRSDDVKAGATPQSILVTVGRDLGDASILVKGDRSSVTITAIAEESATEPVADDHIVPLGGLLLSVGGILEGTLNLPDKVMEADAAPVDYQVQLGDQPLDPVAMHGDQMAVVGTGIDAPASGTETIRVTSPSGASASNEVGIWSYRIDPQPIAHVNQWAPINFQCSGLDRESTLVLTFTPLPGQTIRPEKAVANCGDFAVSAPIAQYRTQVLGDQPLNVRVDRQP
ncbi:MAG: hypothetical protein VR73_10835 [Gammaproteobacteria bacterium BRH_c0]|nr:MAG: hypothetical protein VR73_10835 [Gammaproteobacteria bacterium BRH_c0]